MTIINSTVDWNFYWIKFTINSLPRIKSWWLNSEHGALGEQCNWPTLFLPQDSAELDETHLLQRHRPPQEPGQVHLRRLVGRHHRALKVATSHRYRRLSLRLSVRTNTSQWWGLYQEDHCYESIITTFFQSAMGCWSLRRWRVCRPRSSTRWGITWRTTRTRRRSSITSVASWTSCRCCAPSPSRRFRESSISGLRVLCQSPLSSRSCSPRAFRSEGNFASFNRSCEISRLWCGISAGSGSGEQ